MRERWRAIALVVALAVPTIAVAAPFVLPGESTSATATDSAMVQDLYLLIGQSNMAGRAPIAEGDLAPLDDVYLFSTDRTWVPASNDPLGLNRYSSVEEASPAKTLLGPGYTFGRRIAAETDRQVGLVVQARGATSVTQWRKEYYTGDHALYDEAVRRTRAALEASPGARLRGIIWHQGETDNRAEAAGYYVPMVAEMVADLRADLDAHDAAFVAGEVGTWRGRGRYVNPLIRSLPEAIDHSAWVSTEGLTTHETSTVPWGAHFDAVSQRELGERYADAVLDLLDVAPWALQASGVIQAP